MTQNAAIPRSASSDPSRIPRGFEFGELINALGDIEGIVAIDESACGDRESAVTEVFTRCCN